MQNKKFITIILFLLIANIFLISAAEEISNAPTQNPINKFLQQEISYSLLPLIGSPETTSLLTLLVYTITIICMVVILYDMIGLLFSNNKLISLGISIIITLLSTRNGLLYSAILPIINSTKAPKEISLAGFVIFLVISALIIVALKIFKKIYTKAKNEAEEEKMEERNLKLKRLRKREDIEMASYGIK